ncbi:MAG: hypothetical protein ABSC57_04685 [Syntrophales bacterium]
MQDATCLTDKRKYSGKESELWTPCIYDFFCRCTPILPVSTCTRPAPKNSAPWYTSRNSLKIEGDMYIEPGPNQFMYKIAETFDRKLINDPSRFTQKGDITGIYPDIVVILPNRQGVLVIENKPYGDGSTFDGNQGPGGAYVDFVKWLIRKGIHCEYLVIMPISWNAGYGDVVQLRKDLENDFGVLLLEDIFAAMSKHNFKYERVSENWRDFSDKGGDYA